LVELQARFDEEANITWARALEEVGAHVVYGMVGFKTHCKVCLVVRQEVDGIRRYCHLATGNYNVRTAGIYSDVGLFTCRESFGEDLTELFNLLTGYTRPQKFQHLFLAPMDLREHFIACIRREADRGRAGQTARIIAKVNSLIDPAVIEELYLASQAGVQIDLIVRGMCSLRPGMEGLSERIRVVSVIDRYLEHARIFYFHNNGKPEYLLSSADWMQRNFDHRVEIAFPVLDGQHKPSLKRFWKPSWRTPPNAGVFRTMAIPCAFAPAKRRICARKSSFMNSCAMSIAAQTVTPPRASLDDQLRIFKSYALRGDSGIGPFLLDSEC
jgi:polyphosphate kinase